MSEQRDRSILVAATIGLGAIGLCCTLPAIAALGAVALGLTFGLGVAAIAIVIALAWYVRHRHTTCNRDTGLHSNATHHHADDGIARPRNDSPAQRDPDDRKGQPCRPRSPEHRSNSASTTARSSLTSSPSPSSTRCTSREP